MQPDAVGDLEAARLAQVLHQAHDFSRQATLPQLVVRVRSSATTSPLSRDTAKPSWPRTRSWTSSGESSTGSPPRTTVIDRPASSSVGGRGAVERRQRRLQLLRPFTQPGAERAEVRDQLELDDLAQFVRRVDLVDVQLVRHDVAQDLGRVRREEDQGPGERLAHLDAGLAARGSAERGQPAGQGHLRLEVPVDQRPSRPRANPCRCTESDSSAPVRCRHRVSETNGHIGASSNEKRRQHRVQGRLRGQRVARRRIGIGAPEATPAAPDVPVGEVVDQRPEGGRRIERLVAPQRVGHVGGRAGQAGQDPAVERAALGGRRDGGVAGIEVVQRRVGREEAEGVPQRQQHVAHGGVDGAPSRRGWASTASPG